MNPIDCSIAQHDGPPDVALWRIDFDFNCSLNSREFETLSVDEQARASRFRRHQDAIRFASVRAALRSMLADTTGIAADRIRFATDEAGRPHLADAPSQVDFNVSHSGAHGLIALSTRRRIGVDIEMRAKAFDWRGIARATLAAKEIDHLSAQDRAKAADAFFDAWVAKEALLKAAGVGIANHLVQLTVLPRGVDNQVPNHEWPDIARGLQAVWTAAPRGYAACIAWSPENENFTRQA